MCTIKNIRLLSLILAVAKGVISLYIFALGCFFAGSLPLLRGYGLSFSGYGAGLLLLAMVSFVAVFLYYYGVNSHNRFVLLVTTGADIFVALQIITIATLVKNTTVPVFDKGLQLDCLRNQPQTHTQSQCGEFLNADRTAGFRLFWEGYYTARSNNLMLQVIQSIQLDVCCGFFAPLGCITNNDSFPIQFSHEGISSDLLNKRVQCGPVKGYYPVRSECLQYSNELTLPFTVGGCRYDMGMDYCLDYDVMPYSIGCASAVEDYLGLQVAPLAESVVGMIMVNFVTAFFACCMYFKRKEMDVYPSLATEKVDVEYGNIHDQFVVEPKPGLLVIKGFVPDPRSDAYKAAVEHADEDSVGPAKRQKPTTAKGGKSKEKKNKKTTKRTEEDGDAAAANADGSPNHDALVDTSKDDIEMNADAAADRQEQLTPRSQASVVTNGGARNTAVARDGAGGAEGGGPETYSSLPLPLPSKQDAESLV